MKKEGGELSLRAYAKPGSTMIEVADTGPGIPRDVQRRIFEPFYTTNMQEGQGLGLYITRQLANKNGGNISFRSGPGRGTIFTLEFPSAA